ncbi:MAG: DUF2156 domain-containing protein, partial [Oscillospiraceae bacterium]|nr:DUF2156 domain-containing protein [Oscillospiraceae bacterium]
MLEFRPITPETAAEVRKYYENCTYRLCEYSVGVKLMWHNYLNAWFAEAAGCLIVRCCIGDECVFDYPVAPEGGDEDEALRLTEEWCAETGHRLIWSLVPQEKRDALTRRYPYAALRTERTWRDYLYHTEDLATFAGRRYSGQRNHINKFRKNTPDARFVVLTAEDGELIEAFWREYGEEFRKGDNAGARREMDYAREMFRMLDTGWFCAGGLMSEGRLVALSLGEICGETLQVHIEKALYSHAGAYPAMVQAFAAHFGAGTKWINREDDAGDPGLRTSKLQYLPAELAGKTRMDVGCEADLLRERYFSTRPIVSI